MAAGWPKWKHLCLLLLSFGYFTKLGIQITEKRTALKQIIKILSYSRLLQTGSIGDGIQRNSTSFEGKKIARTTGANLNSDLLKNELIYLNCSSIRSLNSTSTGYQETAKIFGTSSTIVNPHDFKVNINNPNICSASSIFLVIFVHSAVDHFQKRKTIRDTWASVTEYHDRSIRTVFLLGQIKDPKLQTKVEEEAQKYNDIIQEDFIDDYRNLTYKHIMGLKWVTKYCSHANAVVKVDDDTVVNTFKLVWVLETIVQQSRDNSIEDIIYCSLVKESIPFRDPENKWYVSKNEYPAEKYPTYCSGYAYITTPGLVKQLYELSLRTHYFWIDDVYITGILAAKLNVSRTELKYPHGFSMKYKIIPPYNQYVFIYDTFRKKPDVFWRRLWNRMLISQ